MLLITSCYVAYFINLGECRFHFFAEDQVAANKSADDDVERAHEWISNHADNSAKYTAAGKDDHDDASPLLEFPKSPAEKHVNCSGNDDENPKDDEHWSYNN